ncbi:hypothetical protein ASF03_12240 [Rhizobium sp. Leaf68]|nr:hypothetical protein ASE62_11560 [Rhizobium sp. Leaf202]KQN84049.1 hypothetical protein ASF03_12240 [Rhizobium sp. Leaf68]
MHICAITEFYCGTLVERYRALRIRTTRGFFISNGAVRAAAFCKQFSDLDGYGLTMIDPEQETPAMIWHAVTR